jgi:hypothetical protein
MALKSSEVSSSASTTETPGNPEVSLTLTVEGKEFHLGYSRIAKFLDCPYQYQRSYIDGIRSPGNAAMRRGQAYHAVVEGLLNYKINKDGALYPWAKTEAFALKQAAKEKLGQGDVGKVLEAVRFYYDQQYPLHNPKSVEDSFEFMKNGIRFTGRIDLLNCPSKGLIEIIDHKFSYDIWATSKAEYGIQPMVYQWAWENDLKYRFPGYAYAGFAYNIIRVFPSPMIQTIRIKPVSDQASMWWERQVTVMAECMVRGLYYANANEKSCKWCEHKKHCQPCIYKLEVDKTGTETEEYF